MQIQERRTALANNDLSSELESALKADVRGLVRFDRKSRILYSTDASNYKVMPQGVVLPRDVDDIRATIAIASRFAVPVLPRGGGTSLSGQSVGPAIILDNSRFLNQVLEVNTEEGWVRVQAGMVLDRLQARLRPTGLMIGPDPASSASATIGGMIGNNSTGSHSIVYGMVADHLLDVDVVLSDGRQVRLDAATPGEIDARTKRPGIEGQLYSQIPALVLGQRDEIIRRYPRTWRHVAGYNFNRLLAALDPEAGEHLVFHPGAASALQAFNLAQVIAGSEGTLAAIVSARLRLVRRPAATVLAIVQFDDLLACLDSVPAILDLQPACVELIDKFTLDLTRGVPEYARKLTFVEGDPTALLIVEFAGESLPEVTSRADQLQSHLRRRGFTGQVHPQYSATEQANVWAVRKAGFGLLMSGRGDAKALAFVDDATIPVERMSEYARGVQAICQAAGTESSFYAHASAGCLHTNPVINLKRSEGLVQMARIAPAIMDLAISLGGTTTGEHGEGLARSCFDERLFGPQLHASFRQVKALFDPQGLFNPGKIVDAPWMAEPGLLRINPTYSTPYAPAHTTLDFSDYGSFAGLVEMCNGQGTCRKTDAGIMCPSYMATREEEHSTRGRANLLRSAISGELGDQGLADPRLHEALDLCLACKACKTECSTSVDMARLKSEFLDHYHRAHGTPLSSLVYGHIDTVNRLGRLARPLTNWSFRNRTVRLLIERVLGVDRRRSLPELAPQTFEAWYRGRRTTKDERRRTKVIFFHDTFVNHNEPQIGIAAVKVLEAAGYELMLVPKVCCGRPQISKGLLKAAQANARQNIRLLAPYAAHGIPIVAAEPSCVAAMRDEYPQLVPGEPARIVAAQTFFLDEFVAAAVREGRLTLKPLPHVIQILAHLHCHQRALAAGPATLQLLSAIPGCTVQESGAGCCGMAGSFGYEAGHYTVSMQVGEDRLFPAVRAATANTALAAAGTSCRHQIRDATGRRALHPIELIAQAVAE